MIKISCLEGNRVNNAVRLPVYSGTIYVVKTSKILTAAPSLLLEIGIKFSRE